MSAQQSDGGLVSPRNEMPIASEPAIPIVAQTRGEHRQIKVFINHGPPAIGMLEYERPEDVLARMREAVGDAWGRDTDVAFQGED